MGGGGGYPSWPKDKSPQDLMEQASSEETKSRYETEINTYFQGLLMDFNNRNTDEIRKHLDTIQKAIDQEFILISLLYGGSIKKHTYVDGLSDVDVLAIIDKSETVDKSPQEIIDLFAKRLKERLPNTDVVKGKLAVTIRFSDGHEIQILPASRTKTGFKIADMDGIEWSNVIKPDKFAQKLTNVNQNNNSQVVPVIKLFKAINDQSSNNVKLSGYHIESISIEAFDDYEGSKNYKDMLMHLTKYASTAVLEPIKDSTGQSIHVDDKLGNSNSDKRRRISAHLKRVLSQMKVADTHLSLDIWKELMGV